jgi:hypothetical protein
LRDFLFETTAIKDTGGLMTFLIPPANHAQVIHFFVMVDLPGALKNLPKPLTAQN